MAIGDFIDKKNHSSDHFIKRTGRFAINSGKYAGNTAVVAAKRLTVDALHDKINEAQTWNLVNTELKGPFALVEKQISGRFGAPDDLSIKKGSTWGEVNFLGRRKGILQFLHGNLDEISFTAKLFQKSHVDLQGIKPYDVQTEVEKLMSWSEPDTGLGRPPLLAFWCGNRYAEMKLCVITGCSAKFVNPFISGTMRGAEVSLTLREYVKPTKTDKLFDTRYYTAKHGDTHEMIALREYGDPMLGVKLRRKHPDQAVLKAGQVVKAPDKRGSIRTQKLAPENELMRQLASKSSNSVKRLMDEYARLG